MMGSKGRMRDPPGILRWNASYWLESSLCEKQYKCHFLTRSHISSIFRQFPFILVQLKARCASRGPVSPTQEWTNSIISSIVETFKSLLKRGGPSHLCSCELSFFATDNSIVCSNSFSSPASVRSW